MPNVSTLTVRLSANSSKLVAEFSRAQRKSKTFSDKVRGSLRVASRAFGALSGVAGGALISLTAAGVKTADQLAKTADKLGLAANELAGLRFAAEQTGVGVKQLDLGLQRMVRRVAEAAQGTGEAKNALKELNLNAKELTRLSPDEQFRRVADAFELLGSQSDKVRLGFKLFDSEGVGLVNTLAAGRDGLAEFRIEAEQLGLTLDRIQLKNIQEAADAQNKLAKSFSGLGQQLAAVFAPAMEAASTATAEFVSSITQSIPKMADFASAVLGISRAVEDLSLTEARSELAAIFNQLVDAQSNLIKARSDLESIFSGRGFISDTEKANVAAVAEEFARLTVRSQQLQKRLREAKTEVEEVGHVFSELPSRVGNGRAIFEQASAELDGIIQRQERLASSAVSIFEQTRTPIENYVSAMTLAGEALRKNLIDEETFNRFLALWQEKVIKPVEELEEVSSESLDGVNDAARDLGLTFESAFESAIVEGKKLRDVLKGILQDIIRIIARKAITEPFGKFITGLFSGSASASPVGGAGGSAVAAITGGAAAFGFGSGAPAPAPQFNFKIDASGADAERFLGLVPQIIEQSVELSVQKTRDLKAKGTL